MPEPDWIKTLFDEILAELAKRPEEPKGPESKDTPTLAEQVQELMSQHFGAPTDSAKSDAAESSESPADAPRVQNDAVVPATPTEPGPVPQGPVAAAVDEPLVDVPTAEEPVDVANDESAPDEAAAELVQFATSKPAHGAPDQSRARRMHAARDWSPPKVGVHRGGLVLIVASVLLAIIGTGVLAYWNGSSKSSTDRDRLAAKSQARARAAEEERKRLADATARSEAEAAAARVERQRLAAAAALAEQEAQAAAEERRRLADALAKTQAAALAAEAERQRLAEASRKQAEEAARAREAEAQRIAEANRKQAEEAAARVREAEEQRIAEAKRRQAEEAAARAREAEEQRFAEAKGKQAEEAAARAKEAEEKRLAMEAASAAKARDARLKDSAAAAVALREIILAEGRVASARAAAAGSIAPDLLAAFDRAVVTRAMADVDKRFADNPLVRADLYVVIADALEEISLPPLAIEPLERALTTRRDARGADWLSLVSRLGTANERAGRLPEAEAYFRESMELHERTLGLEDPRTLAAKSDLGGILVKRGTPAAAETILRDAVAMQRLRPGGPDAAAFRSMGRLAGALNALGRSHDAKNLLAANEVAARKALAGKDDALLGTYLTALGAAKRGQASYGAAETALRDAHRALTGAPRRDADGIAACVRELVSLYEAWDKAQPGRGHDAQAAEWRSRQTDRGSMVRR